MPTSVGPDSSFEELVQDAYTRFGEAIANGYMGRIATQKEYDGIGESMARRINAEVTRMYIDEDRQVIETIPAEKSEWFHDTRYYYNEDTDTYITFLNSSPKPIAMPGHLHRSMKQAYSNWDGTPATVNEIARQFSFPRAWFNEYKRVHGWTHDSEPFTAEEIMKRDVDDMVDDALQMKRQALFQKYERKEWDLIREEASKFRELERTVLMPLEAKIHELIPTYTPPKSIHIQKSQGPRVAAVISPFDLHYGKYGWSDEVQNAYSRDEAEKLLLGKTEAMIEVVSQWNVEKIYVGIGSDFMHIDTFHGTTTRGTAQDTDGTIAQIIVEGSMLAVKMVDTLRQLAPVEIFCVTGNHDQIQSVNITMFLHAWYRDQEDVIVHKDFRTRQYTTYEKNLLMFTHGDRPNNHKAIASKVPLEAPRDMWGRTKNTMVFVGDKHFKMVQDFDGIHVLQMPSLSGDDRWHDREGYTTSSRGLAGYLIDPEKGLVADIYEPVI